MRGSMGCRSLGVWLSAFIAPVMLCSVLVLPVVQAADDAPRATTANGPLEGVHSDGLDIFRGIPFEAPPVGNLRWRAPQPVVPWRSVRPAAAFGAACP